MHVILGKACHCVCWKAIRVVVLEDYQAQLAIEQKPGNTPLLAPFRNIKIDGPPDFSKHLDAYFICGHATLRNRDTWDRIP